MRIAFRQVCSKAVFRVVLPLVVLAVCLHFLSEQLSADMWRGLPEFAAEVPLSAWLGAILLTAISFLAVGRYDRVAHVHLKTGIPSQQASLSGMSAIGVAQTLGFGLFTGALARWRLLPDLNLGQAFGLSALVSGSFVLAWAVVTALACLLLPGPAWAKWPAACLCLAMPFVAFLLFRWPRIILRGKRYRLPNLRATGQIVLYASVDTFAAAGALWLLLPEGAIVSFLAFAPLFLISLGTALISNTPGGIGPFELMLIGALPHLSADAVMQSIIAFRLVYYALPACLGMLMLLRPFPPLVPRTETQMPRESLAGSPRSEVGVIAQNGGRLVASQGRVAAFWPTAQSLVALYAPLQGGVPDLLRDLTARARNEGLWPLLYKCDAQAAFEARREGWSLVHLADDALIAPGTFSVDIPARRTLRRKLRNATKAGVTIEVPARLPDAELAAIDAVWCAQHGPARGGTMGRFDPAFLASQWVAVARVNGRAVAFVSFFASRREWALDIMRQLPEAPDGTMHALVTHAIKAAKEAGIPSLSLAAVPACPDPQSALWRGIAKAVVDRAGGPGLRQFKSAFAPRWVPRYAAAPGPLRLALCLADVAREVHHPPPVHGRNFDLPHDLDEIYELDSRKRA